MTVGMIISGIYCFQMVGKIRFPKQTLINALEPVARFAMGIPPDNSVSCTLCLHLFGKPLIQHKPGFKCPCFFFTKLTEQPLVDQRYLVELTAHKPGLILFPPGPSPGICISGRWPISFR